ncbi:MAG TPA: 3-phosphoshikimate 1-carboxyvinyltransferase [Verrucomicrobiaceae bacterium]|jgi:3-phosphoshikimate 1-carboxyvinyltransferase
MSVLHSKPLKRVPVELSVPGDKSISHRSVMFAALCEGTTVVENFLPSEDCLASMKAMRALGADIEVIDHTPDGKGLTLSVTGRGMKLREPAAPIDCGNSGTTMRLLSGILAGQSFECRLFGDESLSRRPMKRVADPLATMGARIEGHGEKICAPLTIRGGALHPIQYSLPVASAQVKSAVLLAGLQAPGKTTVIEPAPTRDHTERLLAHFRVKTVRDGANVTIYGGQKPEPSDFIVPGDISSAAFWMVAAAAVPAAQITIRNVGLNPTRTGVIDVLLRMGAQIQDSLERAEGEPAGNVIVKGGDLNATVIGGTEIPNVIDEIPVLAVAAALARGQTVIRDARELRVKESDRIAVVAHNLRLMGVPVDEFEDGMEITGGGPLTAAEIDSHGDHRIAMAFAIAGLFANGMTVIKNTDCIATSYPGFENDLALFLNESETPDVPVETITRVPRKVAERLHPTE